ncbi:MAG: cation transporter, partial [Bdellovibrionales bacterium]|nr:cation transporter [Bdellovibrionales bacterium]
ISREDQVTYNYGFGKLEQVASISVAMALFVTFIVSLFASINRFISPQILENTSFGLFFAILSVIGNSFLWMKNYKLHKTSPSPVSDSQWRLFRAKTCATVVVALSLASSLIFEQVKVGLYFDPLGSLLLSRFLFHSSYTIVSNSMSDLVDRAVDEQVQFIVVRNLIKHEKEYMGLEAVRSRRSGNRMFIDIFLSFSPTSSFDDVCLAVARISSDMERQLPGTEICVIPRPFF